MQFLHPERETPVNQPAYKVSDIAAMTGFSENAIRRAITQKYSDRRPDKDGRELPPLRAKRGAGKQYLVTNQNLELWLESLDDA